MMVAKLDNAEWLTATSRWQIGPTAHLQAVQASSHLVSCLAKASLSALVFLMILLFWDLYTCPQTLAIASACLRSSASVRALVFLCWCTVSFHSQAVEHLTMEDQRTRRSSGQRRMLRKRLLLWLLVVYIDSGLVNRRHSLSGEPLHPRFSSSWKDLGR